MGRAAPRIHPPTHSPHLSPRCSRPSRPAAPSARPRLPSWRHRAAPAPSPGSTRRPTSRGAQGARGGGLGGCGGTRIRSRPSPRPVPPRTAPYRRHVCRESAPKRPPSTEPGSFPARRVDPSTVAHSAEPVHHCKTPGPRARARAPPARAAAIRSARELTPHRLHAHDRRSALASRAAPPVGAGDARSPGDDAMETAIYHKMLDDDAAETAESGEFEECYVGRLDYVGEQSRYSCVGSTWES